MPLTQTLFPIGLAHGGGVGSPPPLGTHLPLLTSSMVPSPHMGYWDGSPSQTPPTSRAPASTLHGMAAPPLLALGTHCAMPVIGSTFSLVLGPHSRDEQPASAAGVMRASSVRQMRSMVASCF